MFLSMEPHPEGLPAKVFNAHLDAYLVHGQLNPEILEHMNVYQQYTINELKKAFKRLKRDHELERESGGHQGEEVCPRV